MTLTRAYIAPGDGGGSGGISEGDHEILDTLTHKIAEDSYTQYIYTGANLTSVIIWTSVGMTLKIRETTFSYTGEDLTGAVVEQYDALGSVIATLTKTFAYNGSGDLESVTVVRS